MTEVANLQKYTTFVKISVILFVATNNELFQDDLVVVTSGPKGNKKINKYSLSQ